MQVKGVMVSNIEKVTQRGDKLDDLGERAGLYFAWCPVVHVAGVNLSTTMYTVIWGMC